MGYRREKHCVNRQIIHSRLIFTHLPEWPRVYIPKILWVLGLSIRDLNQYCVLRTVYSGLLRCHLHIRLGWCLSHVRGHSSHALLRGLWWGHSGEELKRLHGGGSTLLSSWSSLRMALLPAHNFEGDTGLEGLFGVWWGVSWNGKKLNFLNRLLFFILIRTLIT